MNQHIVLLGDSIFDNASYVSDGQSVIDHLRRRLPDDWQATLLAIDGATTDSVESQFDQMPNDASHLVLSIGGNDALGYSSFIMSEPSDSYASSLAGIAEIRDSFSYNYRAVLNEVRAFGLPLAACTIYDSVPGLKPAESAGLAIFNEVITRQVVATASTMIDLRLICDEAADYAAVSPIEPSEAGGQKIARAIHSALFDSDSSCRVIR